MLKDFVEARREIHFPGGSFSVRGLGVLDLQALVRLHLSEMEGIRDTIIDRVPQGGLTERSASDLGLELVQRVPAAMSTVIALAADELDMAESVLKLPLYVQFAALKEISELTFKDIDGLKLMCATGLKLVGDALTPPDPSPSLKGPPS